MKTLSKNGLSGVIEICLLLMMLLDLVLMITLPWTAHLDDQKPSGRKGCGMKNTSSCS